VIDDFLLRPLNPDQAADLLEVIEDRAQLRATIVTSQLPVSLWHGPSVTPPSPTLSWTAYWKAHRIELTGESMRDPEPSTTPRRAR